MQDTIVRGPMTLQQSMDASAEARMQQNEQYPIEVQGERARATLPLSNKTKQARHKQANRHKRATMWKLTLDHRLLPLPALAGGDAVLLQALLALAVALLVGLGDVLFGDGLFGGLGGDLFVTHGCDGALVEVMCALACLRLRLLVVTAISMTRLTPIRRF